MRHTIRFKIPGAEDILYRAPRGMTLLEVYRRARMSIDAPCSGNGTCGKCIVHVNNEWHRACQFIVSGPLTIFLPKEPDSMITVDLTGKREQERFNALRKEMTDAGFSIDCSLELIPLKLKKPDIDDPMADRERVLRGLVRAGVAPEPEISLYALRKLPGILHEGEGDAPFSIPSSDNVNFFCTCVLNRTHGKIRIIDVLSVSSTKPLLSGLALDIGTTSVAAVLLDLQTGEILASGSLLNPQIRYGADVINRIIESTKLGGLKRLREALLYECIVPLIQELAMMSWIDPSQIYKIAVVANTTMTHLFAGVSPEYLRLEPYVPAFFQGGAVRASELELPLHPDAEVLLAPCVGSYVGGDISAGIFASMIFRKETKSIFIDLGTNGELVFGSREFLMTCACSAGPAFEGGDISCGMRAVRGAVESVRIDRDTLKPVLSVIGGGKPAGICGSGLIDLVGELFAAGCIDPRGKFIAGDDSVRVHRDEWGMASYVLAFADETESGRELFISEVDIDNFIRAKGAIFSAIRTILTMLDFSIDDISDVYIAGGIGSGINIEQAIRTGMLPNIPAERYHYLGNTSLAGACAMVWSQKAEQEILRIANNMTYVELSSHPSYINEFTAACFLPHTNSELFQRAK